MFTVGSIVLSFRRVFVSPCIRFAGSFALSQQILAQFKGPSCSSDLPAQQCCTQAVYRDSCLSVLHSSAPHALGRARSGYFSEAEAAFSIRFALELTATVPASASAFNSRNHSTAPGPGAAVCAGATRLAGSHKACSPGGGWLGRAAFAALRIFPARSAVSRRVV